MTDADEATYKLAIETARAHDEARRQQIDDFLRTRSFEDVGSFAAYGCQMRALRLPPWQWPPCWINEAEIDAIIAGGDDPHGRHIAAKLLKRMLEVGVSKYDPDPMRAIEAATKKDAAA
jgi:hypothetical protein